MKKNNHIWTKILFVFLLYSAIFSPPLAIGRYHFFFGLILWPLSLYYVLNHQSQFRLFCKSFSNEIKLVVIVVGYSFVRVMLGGQFSIASDNFFGLITLIIVPFYLVNIAKSIGINSVEGFTKYVLIATSLAIASSILALLIPSVDDYIRHVLIKYREGELGNDVEYRGFGFGSSMSSFYSFCIGMITVLWFFYGKQTGWFKWILPFALIACLVNARTGAMIAVAGAFVYFMSSRNIMASAVTFVIGFIGYVYLNQILSVFLGAETLEWINVFMGDVKNTASGNIEEGMLDYFFNDMVVTPDSTIGWLFGEGYTTFGGKIINGKFYFSDMGFVNQLFFGGLTYCALLYTLVLMVCRRLFKLRQRGLSLFVFICFLIINIKGRFLFATPAFMLTMLYYYAIIEYRQNMNISQIVERNMK